MANKDTSVKVRDLHDLEGILTAHKAAGRAVVHCHGVFDPLHIGHIKHLQSAKALGDILVVTVTPDRFVNKGPHRPIFAELLRAEAIAALGCVDFVGINQWPMAVEAIRLLKPDIFVKGAEFRDKADRTGAIPLEQEAVAAAGGRIEFTDDITFSASNLVNRHMSVFSTEASRFLADFAPRNSIASLMQIFDRIRALKILVLGDAIIDDYQYCEAIGKSSKEPTLVVKSLNAEKFAGGSMAVANHVANFCDQVDLLTFLGDRDSQEDFIRERLHANIGSHFLPRKDSPTIVKRRFVEQYFFHKLFEVYEINDGAIDPRDDAILCRRLRQLLPSFDMVIAMDFGHGAISDEAVTLLCEQATFLAVNTQTNAGNLGYQSLSRYTRADFVCVAENELRLEMRNRRGDLRGILADVVQKLKCQRAIVTRGKRGSLGFEESLGFVEVPAFAGQVVDRIGAGDAFFSMAAPGLRAGATLEQAAFLGNAAGAQAVATVGHRTSLERVSFSRYLEHLLK